MSFNRPCIIFFSLLFFCLTVSAQDESANTYLKNTDTGRLVLTQEGASHFARLALDCIQQEYPNKLNQVLTSENSLAVPSELHPAFYGCFDWHSSVHGHWMLVRLLKQFPNISEAEEIRNKLRTNLTKENIRTELAYFCKAEKSWERTYGWAWLLKLSEELYSWNDEQGQILYNNLLPLTEKVLQRYESFLAVQKYPIRAGTHPNTAFGLAFAWDYAETTGAKEFQNMVESQAKKHFIFDHTCPADWEPGGEDFLSGCMVEADLMSRFLTKRQFSRWFKYFMPKDKLLSVALPAKVTDRSDPKIVHLDGLNFSRVWSMYGIMPKLSKNRYRKILLKAAEAHLKASLPFVATEHYEGGHWLAGFAVYALSAEIEQQTNSEEQLPQP